MSEKGKTLLRFSLKPFFGGDEGAWDVLLEFERWLKVRGFSLKASPSPKIEGKRSSSPLGGVKARDIVQ